MRENNLCVCSTIKVEKAYNNAYFFTKQSALKFIGIFLNSFINLNLIFQ